MISSAGRNGLTLQPRSAGDRVQKRALATPSVQSQKNEE
jgi:hypothetical protein